jgi:ferredoxin/flavodoxin---NADP+ reductase
MANWIEGKVVEKILWTENLFSLKVDADVDDYTAGQFTSLALMIDDKRIARPYSFLSAPQQKPLEFFFYTAVDGVLSNALIELVPGDTILVKEKSNGFFVLNELPDSRDLWMIGTGTGIAPFFSILKTDEPWERYENVVLVQGVRTESDLQYQSLIEEIQHDFPTRFTFQAFVSREPVAGAIQGRIPAAIESGLLEDTVNRKLEVAHSQIMLCGNPDMVKDTVEILKSRGFEKNLRKKPGHITTENYW